MVLVGIWLFAMAIRVFFAWYLCHTPLAGDEGDYYRQSTSLLNEFVLNDTGKRLPFHQILLALEAAVFGTATSSLRIGSAFVGSLVVFPIFFLGKKWGGEKVGLTAAFLGACYPEYIAFSHYFWAESHYLLFASIALVLLISAAQSRKYSETVLAGFLFGLVALTREVGLAVTLTLAFWLAWSQKQQRMKSLGLSAVFLLTAIVTILPWTIYLNRNIKDPSEFSFLTRTTHMNLFIGNCISHDILGIEGGETLERLKYIRIAKGRYAKLGRTYCEREKAARPLAIQSIKEQLPVWPIKKTYDMLPRLFAPSSFVVRRLLIEPEGRVGKWAYLNPEKVRLGRVERQSMAIVLSGTTVIIMISGFFFLVFTNVKKLPIGASVVFLIGHIWPTLLTFSCTRFRFPMVLVLLLAISWGILNAQSILEKSSTRRKVVAGFVALVVVLLTAVHISAFLSDQWI